MELTSALASTRRYPDPNIAVNDSIKFDLVENKIVDFCKFEAGNLAMVTGGANAGRSGVIVHRERAPGGFDIIHIRDILDRQFATRISNVFVTGSGNKAWISLPKGAGVKVCHGLDPFSLFRVSSFLSPLVNRD